MYTSSWILEEQEFYKKWLSFKMTKLAYQAHKKCPAVYVREAVLSASWPRLHPPPPSAFLTSYKNFSLLSSRFLAMFSLSHLRWMA